MKGVHLTPEDRARLAALDADIASGAVLHKGFHWCRLCQRMTILADVPHADDELQCGRCGGSRWKVKFCQPVEPEQQGGAGPNQGGFQF